MMRALHAPFPAVRFIPTGGISATNAAAYLGLPGVAALVGGSWMVAPSRIRDREFASIAELAGEAVRIASGGAVVSALAVRPAADCRYDLVALGEVMLRLDPGEGRIRTARSFRAWEGGGEYNVARGLRRCFGMKTGPRARAFADNDIGRLIEDFILQGGVDTSLVKWAFTTASGGTCAMASISPSADSAFAARWACPDRGNTAASQLKPGDIDWERLFGELGVRWLHTGGIFAALSETTPTWSIEAVAGGEETRHHCFLRPQLPSVSLEGHRRARRRARSTAASRRASM